MTEFSNPRHVELAQISQGKLHEQLTRLVEDTAKEIDHALPEGAHVQLEVALAAR